MTWPCWTPIWSTADVSRNHGHAVFDTLYGMDAHFAPKPQMAPGRGSIMTASYGS